jgi:DNA-binding winged helix-turn-helix (wHTH) protein
MTLLSEYGLYQGREVIMCAFIVRSAHPESGFDVEHAVQRQDMDNAIFEKRTESYDVPPTKVSFGPFCLLPTRFLLLEGEKPVPVGSRALEILIALLERRGEIVSNQDLFARVWPNLSVDPSNLTVHVSALRRALRDGWDGRRFIVNIRGRGYCFVASVSVSGDDELSTNGEASASFDDGLRWLRR